MTDIFKIDINRLVISDKVSCNNNGKDCCYIVGYQVDEALILLSIKTPKNVFSHGVSQYDKNSAYTMSLNVSEEKEWGLHYRNFWSEVETQLFEKLATEPIKGKYACGKLKAWKESINTNFHGQYVPYSMYRHGAAVLKIDSVYKEGKNYHPQAYVEECQYTNAENKQCC